MSRTAPAQHPACSVVSFHGLHVGVHRGCDASVLDVHGEADIVTAPILARALDAASAESHPCVVLDVEDLRFIDAHCLGIISRTAVCLHADGRDLVVRSSAPLVRRLFGICGMQTLLAEPLSLVDAPLERVEERAAALELPRSGR